MADTMIETKPDPSYPNHPGWKYEYVLSDGETRELKLPVVPDDRGVGIIAIPGTDATTTVEFAMTSPDSDTLVWIAWPAGGVTSNTTQKLNLPADYLRFNSSGGSSRVIVGI